MTSTLDASGDERTVIVTGATGGLGRRAAAVIAGAGKRWHVVLAARDMQSA